MPNFDLIDFAIKTGCGATNELIYDDQGMPGAYVRKQPHTLNQLLNTTDTSIHPAFLIDGNPVSKLCIGKYQGYLHDSRIYSLPGVDPVTSINLDNYVQYCRNKGAGHHCITAAEWAFLVLLAKKNGIQPKGNNNYGKDHSETTYIAIPTYKDGNGRTCRVATGTGPLTWSDTGTRDGIWDLNGNVWEWAAGIRLVKGELQVIPYNNAADPECNTGATSSEWRAINAAATAYSNLYMEPNGQGTTSGSVKLDMVNSHWQWGTTIADAQDSGRNAPFANTTYAAGISDFCKMYLRAMALGPDAEDTNYNDDRFYANNGADELCASCGGSWGYGASIGIFALSFYSRRSYVGTSVGGRPAYYE